jgi:hypothetical protein
MGPKPSVPASRKSRIDPLEAHPVSRRHVSRGYTSTVLRPAGNRTRYAVSTLTLIGARDRQAAGGANTHRPPARCWLSRRGRRSSRLSRLPSELLPSAGLRPPGSPRLLRERRSDLSRRPGRRRRAAAHSLRVWRGIRPLVLKIPRSGRVTNTVAALVLEVSPFGVVTLRVGLRMLPTKILAAAETWPALPQCLVSSAAGGCLLWQAEGEVVPGARPPGPLTP